MSNGFPIPPKSNRQFTSSELPPPPQAIPQATPIGPDKVKGGERLTDAETEFILKQYLKPTQYSDPMVLHFILAYLECRNATQAAKEAGFTTQSGYQLRMKPEIHAAIEALTAKAVMKFGYDASEVIERVKEISALDPIEFENPDGSFKTHMSQIKPEARRAIKKFKAKNIFGKDANDMPIVIGQLIEVEMWDKLKATELLGREKGVMKETKKIEHDVTSNMKDLLLESKNRAEARMLSGAIDVTPKGDDESE